MSTMTAECTSQLIGERFLALLPALQTQLSIAFRHFQPEQREDAIHEAVAHAFAAFARLWQRGRQQVARPTPLARYAVAHWFAGRRVGTPLNGKDVTSPYCQRQNHTALERLDHYDAAEHAWREVAVEDRRTPVPDQAAFRVDFPAWLRQLSRRDRQIALRLAAGASTSEVAERFQLSWPRISQLRREFHESWLRFHGDLAVAETTVGF